MRTLVAKLNFILVVGLLTFPMLGDSAPLDDIIIKKNSTANEVVLRLILSDIISESLVNNEDLKLAQEICLLGGRKLDTCMGVSYRKGPETLAQGLCLAGGRKLDTCMGVSYRKGPETLAQGLCLAGGIKLDTCMGVSYKKGPSTIEESLELIADKLKYIDLYWYWDKFRDQYGSPQWYCRGSQTGQFANNSKCSGQIKDDDRWPG